VTEPSDEALLAAHLRGDPQAFGALVTRHERRIYGLCLRITGNREDAEDATQDAFLAALRKAATFRKAAAFSTWLYRIAVNAATDQARRRARARLTPLDPEDATQTTAPGGELGEEVASAVTVQLALTHVPEEFRVAVVLCDLYRLPYADAAQILEIPVGTVKSRVFRGRLALAEHLGRGPENAGEGSGVPEARDSTGPGVREARPAMGPPVPANQPTTGPGAQPSTGSRAPLAHPASAPPANPDGTHATAGGGVPGAPGGGLPATSRGEERRRPPLRVVGGAGTEAGPAASDPTEADRPHQE
jgi:RNA polymerase sigma-70 factor, ECF subfamily